MVGSPQVILRRFASPIKSAPREGVGSVVLTGMLSGPVAASMTFELNRRHPICSCRRMTPVCTDNLNAGVAVMKSCPCRKPNSAGK
jgi:hypothetical protein